MLMNFPLIITFTIYILAMLAIGLVFYRLTANLSDYILGGRKLGSLVAALSVGASDMSGWLLLGLPGAVYSKGINQIWIAIGLSLGAYLNWKFIAEKLRLFTEKANNSITIPQYLENRFEDTSGLLRIISAFVILLFFTIYTTSGLVAGAILFKNTLGISYQTALLSGAFIIVTYTFLGGFLAVSWTDFFQGTLMLFALMIVPIMVINETGGWNPLVQHTRKINPKLLDPFSGLNTKGIISLMAWGLGYFGQPHILARFMAIKSPDDVPRARRIGMSWMIITLSGAILVGFAGIAFFANEPLKNSETVFIILSKALFNPWISGILLAAILSAIMSTVDSQLLVCSGAITEDFYRSKINPMAAQKRLVWIGRISVLIISIIAVIMALNPNSTVLSLVAYAWAGFGASFGPVIILSLYWKNMTRNGALAGMITGAVTVIIWKNLRGGIFNIYEILPGFLFGAIAIFVFSMKIFNKNRLNHCFDLFGSVKDKNFRRS